MDRKIAILFMPDDMTLTKESLPLMLRPIVFCPILTWMATELMGSGIERFFVVSDVRAHDVMRPYFPEKADVTYVDGAKHGEELQKLLKGEKGEVVVVNGAVLPVGQWSGGAVYRICPRRAYERFALKHTAMMKSLGFRGLGYLDVTTSRPLFPCTDARHPLSNAERRVWENDILDLQTKAFGGCASEGGYDFAIGHFDSALTISFQDPFNEGRKKWNPLVDGRIPFWQIAYHGVIMSNPFRNTWNAAKNPDRRVLLKTVEYGARPVFYVYGGWNLPERAAWDIKCRTDEELADCVKTVCAGMDEYRRRAALEWEFMDEHRELAKGVFRVTYSNGAKVYVNYTTRPVTVDGVTLEALSSEVTGL